MNGTGNMPYRVVYEHRNTVGSGDSDTNARQVGYYCVHAFQRYATFILGEIYETFIHTADIRLVCLSG